MTIACPLTACVERASFVFSGSVWRGDRSSPRIRPRCLCDASHLSRRTSAVWRQWDARDVLIKPLISGTACHGDNMIVLSVGSEKCARLEAPIWKADAAVSNECLAFSAPFVVVACVKRFSEIFTTISLTYLPSLFAALLIRP